MIEERRAMLPIVPMITRLSAWALTVALLTATWASAATIGISEDFDDGILDGSLEQNPAGTWGFSNDSDTADPDDEAIPGSGRSYIRTTDSDYKTAEFIAEVTYTAFNGSGAGIAFLGLGAAERQDDFFDAPSAAIAFENDPGNRQSGEASVVIYDGDEEHQALGAPVTIMPEKLTSFAGLNPGNGTHRLRLSKEGDLLTFEIDAHFAADNNTPGDADGGLFDADGSYSISLTDPRLTLLDTSNSRIFFGTQAGGNTSFDDFSITPEPTSTTLLALAALGLIARRRRE
jgi:hypothetical protein